MQILKYILTRFVCNCSQQNKNILKKISSESIKNVIGTLSGKKFN